MQAAPEKQHLLHFPYFQWPSTPTPCPNTALQHHRAPQKTAPRAERAPPLTRPGTENRAAATGPAARPPPGAHLAGTPPQSAASSRRSARPCPAAANEKPAGRERAQHNPSHLRSRVSRPPHRLTAAQPPLHPPAPPTPTPPARVPPESKGESWARGDHSRQPWCGEAARNGRSNCRGTGRSGDGGTA